LSGIDVWVWPYNWITEMPELNEQQKSEIPWNWNWNFRWVFDAWASNIDVLRLEQVENVAQMNGLVNTWESDFRAWVVETKFNGDVDRANALQKHFVDQSKKEKSRQLNNLLTFG